MDRVTLLIAIFDIFVIAGCIWWLSRRFRSKIAEVEERQANLASQRRSPFDSEKDT